MTAASALLPALLCAVLLVSSCSSGDEPVGRRGGGIPEVVVDTVREAQVIDHIEAVGTARANEQADISSTVTERIARINFRDGQYVPKGAIIAELVHSQQSASLEESRARLREAELQLARLKQLQGQGFATRARVDEQQAAVDIARAQGASASSQIADRVIRAPFSGHLSLRRISPGAVVTSGTTLVTIVDISRIKLDFTVPETFIPVLKPGLAIEARAAAWPGELFRGTIETVDPVLDPVSRAATARAILPNPDQRLRPGMLITIDIGANPRTGLMVPETAIVGEGAASHVWKLGANDEVERVVVETGSRRGGMVEIRSGLAAGDRIVTEGTVKIRGPGPVRPAGHPDSHPDSQPDSVPGSKSADKPEGRAGSRRPAQ